jgi:hypothetical protein
MHGAGDLGHGVRDTLDYDDEQEHAQAEPEREAFENSAQRRSAASVEAHERFERSRRAAAGGNGRQTDVETLWSANHRDARPSYGEAANDAHADEFATKVEAPRRAHVRKPRKRKKRLSLTISPGLLSAMDPSTLGDDAREARASTARQLNTPARTLQPAAVTAPLEASGLTHATPGQSAKLRETLPLPGPASRISARTQRSLPDLSSHAVALDVPFGPNSEPHSAHAAAPEAERRRPPAIVSPERAAAVPLHAGVSAPSRPRTVLPFAKTDQHAGSEERAPTRPSWQEFGGQAPPRPHPNPDDPTGSATPSDAFLAEGTEETRGGWSSASTLPPPHWRKRWVVIAAASATLLAVIVFYIAHSNEPRDSVRADSAPPAVSPAPTATRAQPEPASPPATADEAPQAAAAPDQVAEPPLPIPQLPQPVVVNEQKPQPSAAAVADANAMLARAQKLEEQGKQKQALSLFEEAAAQMPTNSQVLSRLAFGYLNRGRNANAATFATRAVEAEPSNSEGWIVLGVARYQMGDRKGAMAAYRKCAELGRGAYVAECRRMVR